MNQRAGLDSQTPVLFLPVNIQTRFMDVAQSSELWVRIYPDQIAVNTHEPGLTLQEITDGRTYWDFLWRAGNPAAQLDELKAPWRGLASLYGSQRAAWIALQLTPLNVASQPSAPTPDGATPSPAPDFPNPPGRAESWTQPATADALPDEWTVVTVAGTQTSAYHGTAILPNLAIGPTPPAQPLPAGSSVDSGMKWLVDFDAALAAGMAVKIPLTREQRTQGFDRIFVYGLRSHDAAAADTWAQLLDAHHYTDGFSLVPQGAPTNNTADASSAFSRKDPNYEISFSVERQGSLATDSNADGSLLARLIGIDPAHLAHVGYSDGSGARNGTDMLTALWPATIGYFLSQMMSATFTPQQIETARQYVLSYTLPRGPIPAFRIGKTPYGILPITSLARYAADQRLMGGSVEPGLVTFLRRLWPNWLASSAGAPRMQNTGDPDSELVALLGMDASSMTFRGRQVLGDEFMWNYLNFAGIPVPVMNQWWLDHLVRGRTLLDSYQYNSWDPRVIHLGLAQSSFPIALPTVQAGALSETDPLQADANLGGGKTGNYVEWLRQASINDLRLENYPGPKPTALLYKILRQSALLDYVRMASIAEMTAGRLQLSQIRESEIMGVPAPAAPAPAPTLPSVSPWEVLARPSGPNPKLNWAEYLVSLDPPPASPFVRLAEMRASFDRLSSLPTAELDRLLTETLDACSHRLDVWATTVANAILQRSRDSQVSGMHLGAFGWVEEVRPAPAPAAVAGSELQQVQALDSLRSRKLQNPGGGPASAVPPVPVQPREDNGGFIHAPSLVQASVAAVLRNGYMTHKGTTEEGLLSIDLSSQRVRNALTLLDGVRQGQSLNALLGYLFEAGLHDLELDQYAQPFRDRFPVVGDKLTASSDPSESVAASNVVDGLALNAAWTGNKLLAGQVWGGGLPGPGADQNNIIGVLKTIEDYADALGDVSISEAVFQIIRGNFGRAGGLLDAISKGIRPPEPDVVNTSRGGVDLTHRVAVLFAGNPAVNPHWAAIPKRPRAAAEPWLDAWLSQLLPDPVTVHCEVRFTLAGANQVKSVTLADLEIGPLDCLAIADAADVPQQSELEFRLLYFAVPPAATNPTIDYQPAAAPPGSIIFSDFFFLVKSLRNLVGSARALAPQDLTLPENKAESAGGTLDIADLRSRASATISNLSSDVGLLQAAIPGLPGVTAPVRDALLRCSLYAIPGSIPLTGADADSGLAAQATSVATILTDRFNRAAAIPIATAEAADVLEAFAIVFGTGFSVLPRFTPPDFATLKSAFGQSSSLVASDPVAPARWLMQLTHVRPAISRLDAALSLAQTLSGGEVAPPSLLLGQLRFIPGDRWLALPIDPGSPPEKGRVALACITQGDPITQNTYAGLLVDEWPERIPSIKENAAVAFHYEEPKARAPQSLLLAVCPDSRPTWDDDLIMGTLQEALELAKIRTVDLDSVQQVGQILPALYFALNLKGAAVSSKFLLEKEVFLGPSTSSH